MSETPETPAEKLPAETPETPAPQLGDAGKKALDEMKSKWHSERDQRKALESRIAELEAASKQPAAPSDDAIKSAIAEVTNKNNARLLRSEIKAAAKGVLADPTDAFRYLDLDSFEVSDDGEIDESAVSDALTKLVESKPYLSAQSEKRFQGTGDGGARKASGPSQLSREDLRGMSAEAIVKAKAEGRLKNLMSGE